MTVGREGYPVGPILVAVDFSGQSGAVVTAGAELALALSEPLYLVHVAPPEPYFVGYEVGPQHVRDNMAHHLRKEHRDLQNMATDIRERGVETTALLLQGPTAETLRHEVSRLGARMIVMGRHSRSGIADFFIGSTCRELVKSPPCLVTLVPEQGGGNDIPPVPS
ncbi:MAG: universal stress protein [Leptospirillia bacterium]